MATGSDALSALRDATRDLPAGSEYWIDVFRKLDLCKLRVGDLISAGFDPADAEEVVARLNRLDVSRLGQALGLRLLVQFKVWADREGDVSSLRCESESNSRWLSQYLQQRFPAISITGPQKGEESLAWNFQVQLNDQCTPYQLLEALTRCPAIMPMRLFPVTVEEQPHFLLQAFNLASWIEDQGEDIWWTADGDPKLMSRLEFPAPPDEMAAVLREVGRPLLVADPNGVAHGEELAFDEIEQAVNPDEWGQRRLLLRWAGNSVDWILVEDEPTSESSSMS